MISAILGTAVGSYVLDAIASGGIKTLQQLAVENAMQKYRKYKPPFS